MAVREATRSESRAAENGATVSFSKPRSRIVERRCTREYAGSLVRRGIHPKGCIWIPGNVNDHPDIGDLFAPDPEWNPPSSISPASAPLPTFDHL